LDKPSNFILKNQLIGEKIRKQNDIMRRQLAPLVHPKIKMMPMFENKIKVIIIFLYLKTVLLDYIWSRPFSSEIWSFIITL